MALRVFCRPGIDKILITPPTYGMYSVSAQINDVGVERVPLIVTDDDDHHHHHQFQLNLPQVIYTNKRLI